MKILTAKQMQSVDARATQRFGIPSLVLMENAALAVVDAIFEHYRDCERVALRGTQGRLRTVCWELCYGNGRDGEC